MYKLSIILTIIVVALGSALSLSVEYGIRRQAECRRLSTNQSALLEQIETFQVRDSLNGASIRMLTLRGSEFEAHFASLNLLIRDMGVKLKHVENLSQSATRSSYQLQVPVTDSLVREGGDSLRLQALHYDDPYLSVSGVIRDAKFSGSIVCRDSLTQVIHRVPRRFWFIRWGTKELRQIILSSNPHTQIVYSQSIKIDK